MRETEQTKEERERREAEKRLADAKRLVALSEGVQRIRDAAHTAMDNAFMQTNQGDIQLRCPSHVLASALGLTPHGHSSMASDLVIQELNRIVAEAVKKNLEKQEAELHRLLLGEGR